jgi:hypothetical protein
VTSNEAPTAIAMEGYLGHFFCLGSFCFVLVERLADLLFFFFPIVIFRLLICIQKFRNFLKGSGNPEK